MHSSPARLRWDCRRGMLELDLLLLPFFEKYFADLSEQEKQGFERLLANQDQDLYDWLVKQQPAPDNELVHIIKCILQQHAPI